MDLDATLFVSVIGLPIAIAFYFLVIYVSEHWTVRHTS
jgi:hypothetical protein